MLAEIAAIGGILAILLPVHFLRVNDLVPQVETLGEVDGHSAMVLGITRAVGRDGTGAISQRATGHIGEIGAVDTAAVRDDHGAKRCKHLAEHLRFLREACIRFACLIHHSSQFSSLSSSSSSSSSSSLSSASS